MFLKFGSERDITDLYENGTIYMNPIQRFRKLEDNELRGDPYEGVSKIHNFGPGEFEIPKLNYKGNFVHIHLRESYENVYGNIYSLYCISSHGWEHPDDFYIDQKIKDFGTHCLMVKDNQAFLEMIKNRLKELEVPFEHGFVEYYDKQVENREISLFEKPLEFEYQKEFRIYAYRKETTPFQLSIGSLKNIGEIYLTNQIVDGLTLTSKQL